MNNFIEKIPEVGMQLKNVPKNKILEVSKDKNFFVFGQNYFNAQNWRMQERVPKI